MQPWSAVDLLSRGPRMIRMDRARASTANSTVPTATRSARNLWRIPKLGRINGDLCQLRHCPMAALS